MQGEGGSLSLGFNCHGKIHYSLAISQTHINRYIVGYELDEQGVGY